MSVDSFHQQHRSRGVAQKSRFRTHTLNRVPVPMWVQLWEFDAQWGIIGGVVSVVWFLCVLKI